MAPSGPTTWAKMGPVMPIRTRTSLRVAFAALAAAGLGGCAQFAGFATGDDPSTSETAQDSYGYCQQGATCVLKPLAMLVLNKDNPSVNFDYRGWLLYDPRPWPLGNRYVAFMNGSNDPVCEGYYASLGINMNAPTALTCFPREAKGKGTLRFHTLLQREGPFAGRSTGTGLFETDVETVLIVHGATPEENQKAPFNELWDKYGGNWQRALTAAESGAKRIPDLPKLTKGATRKAPASASIGSR
jgi:hypothetical protein